MTVIDSTLSSNVASISGGAIYVGSTGSLTVINSTLTGNLASTSGAGLFSASPTSLTDTTLEANGALNSYHTGGGATVVGNGDLDLVNVLFLGNAAGFGGGLRAEGVNVTADANTRFEGNIGLSTGGGANLLSIDEDVVWTGGTFVGNDCPFGGGLQVDTSNFTGSATISNVIADGNNAVESGGGVHLQGDRIVWTDSLSLNNTSNYGGGTSFNNTTVGQMVIERVDLIDNVGDFAGAADVFLASALMVDCIVTGNLGVTAGGFYLDDTALLEFVTTDFGLGPEANLPNDVFFDTMAGTTSVVGLGAQVTAICDPVTRTCQ